MTNRNGSNNGTTASAAEYVRQQFRKGVPITVNNYRLELVSPEQMALRAALDDPPLPWRDDMFAAYITGPCQGSTLAVEIFLSVNLVDDEAVDLVAHLLSEFRDACLTADPPPFMREPND